MSPEPKKSACVAGDVDDGVCRRQAYVAGVDRARRVSRAEKKTACVAEEEGDCGRVTSRGCSGGRGDVDEELAGAAVKIVFTMSCLGGVC